MNRHTNADPFPGLLESFFCERLMNQQNVSHKTVEAYRDTFRLLLRFIESRYGRRPCNISLQTLDAELILDFLKHLETERGNCIRTRNARLAAIRSFFHYAATRNPAQLAMCQRVLAIPVKRFDRPALTFLTREEIQAILSAPDCSKWTGRRDVAMFTTLYNTGARVSELVGISLADVDLGLSGAVTLHGKGRKERTVPLWKTTSRLLANWQRENAFESSAPLFPDAQRTRLSRSGVEWRLHRCVQAAARVAPSLRNRSVSPHTIRHTTALHLLQSGVDITVIALWLGHESIQTTHMYLEADLRMKERALNLVQPPAAAHKRYKPDDRLLRFLDAL